MEFLKKRNALQINPQLLNAYSSRRGYLLDIGSSNGEYRYGDFNLSLIGINNYKRMLAYSSIENMGILIIGLALGGVASVAAIIHLIGHSLIKASFFLTSGNVLKIYSSKKIKSVTGIILVTDFLFGEIILSERNLEKFIENLLFNKNNKWGVIDNNAKTII